MLVIVGLIVILSLVALSACGRTTPADDANGNASTESPSADGADDAATTPNEAGVVSPPAWLVGEWTPKDPVLDGQDILVTENNVVFNSGLLDIEWQVKNTELEVSDSTDGEVYTLAYNAGGVDFSYVFTPKGENALTLRINTGDVGTDMDFVRK